MEGCGHGSLDFHAPTKRSLTYKWRLPKVLKIGFRRRRVVGGPGMNPTTPCSLYIWVGLSLFALEFGGGAVYMETHPKLLHV